MNTIQPYNSFTPPANFNDDVIHFILKAVESRVNELKESINVSKDVYPLGIDTDFTTKIKNVVENPLSHLLTMKKDLNSTISSIITNVVKEFFSHHKEKIQKVVITDTNSNDSLHFSIVLNEDTSDNRGAIFSLLREYKDTSLWESYPIYFQIVPKSIANKISGKEIVSC